MDVGKKRKRCGECAGCTSVNCGSCKFCLDNPKFGGTGKKKKACIQRRCLRMGNHQPQENQLQNETISHSQSKPSTRKPLSEILKGIPGTARSG